MMVFGGRCMDKKIDTIESYLLRLIEDLAVVKSRLHYIDELNSKVDVSLDKMDKQAIKLEATVFELVALKDKVMELDRRVNKIEDSIKANVDDTNKAYRNIAYSVAATVIGAMILYFINLV